MAEIKIIEAHALGADEAKKRVGVFEEMLGKFGVKMSWSGHNATFKGVGVSGSMNVSDTNAQIKLKLGMLARAAGVDGKRLQSSISRRLREAFDAE